MSDFISNARNYYGHHNVTICRKALFTRRKSLADALAKLSDANRSPYHDETKKRSLLDISIYEDLHLTAVLSLDRKVSFRVSLI